MLKDYKLVLLVSLVSYFQSNAMDMELRSSEPTPRGNISSNNNFHQKVYVTLTNPYIVPRGKKLTDKDKEELRKNKIFPSQINTIDYSLFKITFEGAICKLRETYGKEEAQWYKYHKLLGMLEFTLKPRKKQESVRKYVESAFKGVPYIYSVTREHSILCKLFKEIKEKNSIDTRDKNYLPNMLKDIENINIDDTIENDTIENDT